MLSEIILTQQRVPSMTFPPIFAQVTLGYADCLPRSIKATRKLYSLTLEVQERLKT
jgi:hypothetical protein